jgi:PAS domain S-box-containing protein
MTQEQHRGRWWPTLSRGVRVAWASLQALRNRRKSVRGKLVGVVLATTVIVLMVAGTAILARDLSVYRASWVSDIATEANILSQSTAPALAFDDRKIAAQNLAAMQARGSVLAVGLYSSDGRLYASFVRPGEALLQTDRPPMANGTVIHGERIEIAQPISYNHEFLGTIYLRARYNIWGRVGAYIWIFAFISGLSMLLALLLSFSLHRSIITPLDAMADVARRIVDRHDYSPRVEQRSEDEIGIVVQAFNRMLDEVLIRTQALEQSNLSLRQEVAVRLAAEAALARANVRLETTMAAAEIGGWTRDLKTGELVVDRNFAALYGVADESRFTEDPELNWRLIHADDREAVDQSKADALRTGTLASPVFRILQPDGAVRWVVGRGKVQFGENHEPLLLAGLLIDITAQKQAEEKRRDSENVYRAIGESIDYGVWLTDAEGRNTYASESFLRLTGLTQEQCSEFGWGTVLHPDDAEATMAAWRECLLSGGAWYREHRILGTDGLYHPVLAQGVPIRREDGRAFAWAGINLDISRMKRTEDALREADRLKDEFLATLAHELRNPLAPIGNASRLLGAAHATDQQRQWAREVIGRQVQHMALLLDDLLDVSRITSGRLELKKDCVGLAELVGSAIETARPLLEEKGHDLQIRLLPEAVSVHVDPLRISQVLCNLLTNGAKYTDAGGKIVLAAELDSAGLSISVSDNGIGLPADAIPHVFDMFFQVGSVLERGQGGLGIGLALSRGLVALHGGTIEAASDGPGRGSTFTVRLPSSILLQDAPPAPIMDEDELEPMNASTCKVLVADDNCDAADSLAALLEFQGYEVLVAHSGREALDLALRTRPQILVLDIGMPQMNGYELAQRIRKESWGRASLLIALTGWGQKDDLERARSSGFDHHLKKPAELSELLAMLKAFHLPPEQVTEPNAG